MPTTLDHLIDIANERAHGVWQPSGPLAEIRNLRDGAQVRLNIDHWVRTDCCGTTACIIGHGLLDERTHKALVHPQALHAPCDEYALNIARELQMDRPHIIQDLLAKLLFMPLSYNRIGIVGEACILRHFLVRAKLIRSTPPEHRSNIVFNLLHSIIEVPHI